MGPSRMEVRSRTEGLGLTGDPSPMEFRVIHPERGMATQAARGTQVFRAILNS